MSDPAVEAFLKSNLDFIQKHRKNLAKRLSETEPVEGEIVTQVNLDDDLMGAFNQMGGNSEGQLIILQLQTNRRLERIVGLLSELVPPKPVTEIKVGTTDA